MREKLKAPFPWFGGKSRLAALAWEALGDPDNYVEPFLGSAATLLLRPHPPRVETVNDYDCYVANFWRATGADPDAVAAWADGPVNEADLHARHRWLVLSEDAAAFRARMRTDPHHFDAKIAGWWCWGLCCWIGGGWCSAPEEVGRNDGATPALMGSDGQGQGVVRNTRLEARRPVIANPGSDAGKGVHGNPPEQLPMLTGEAGASGRGLHAKMPNSDRRGDAAAVNLSQQVPLIGDRARGVHRGPGPCESERMPHIHNLPGNGMDAVAGHRPQLADAYSRGRGVHGNDAAGTCAQRLAWLKEWFGRLRDRLRTVRVCCGHWLRVCDSESVTTRLGETGAFLDPPYAHDLKRMHAWVACLRGEGAEPPPRLGGGGSRDANLYATDSADVDRLVAEVHLYCAERGSDPMMRLALCGYQGEHDALEQMGWEVVRWKAQGGYGNRSAKGKENAGRERLWLSPHCLRQPGLFDGLE